MIQIQSETDINDDRLFVFSSSHLKTWHARSTFPKRILPVQRVSYSSWLPIGERGGSRRLSSPCSSPRFTGMLNKTLAKSSQGHSQNNLSHQDKPLVTVFVLNVKMSSKSARTATTAVSTLISLAADASCLLLWLLKAVCSICALVSSQLTACWLVTLCQDHLQRL